MNKPEAIRLEEWAEIMRTPDVREAWGLEETETPESFAERTYGAKFDYMSGGPGYFGELFMILGDSIAPPMILTRNRSGELVVDEK